MSEAIYRKANELLKAGDPASAEAAIRMLADNCAACGAGKAGAAVGGGAAKAWFEYAGAFDYLGREAEALPHYERVFEIGVDALSAEDRPRIYVQTGSTMRNLKMFTRAREVLLDGISKFPDVAALKAFLGLVEYSDGRHAEAARLFLAAGLPSAGDHSMQDYSRALRYYLDEL